MQSAARQGHEDAIAELEGAPEVPPDATYLWVYYQELRKGIGGGCMGGSKVTWRDIEAWARVSRRVIRPIEANALLDIDEAIRETVTAAEAGDE